MHQVKGQHLYVGLGASQTRRRLRGFGHGVKQVQTAGKGRAMIVHTATGQHLDELKALFADVLLPTPGEETTASEQETTDEE